MVDLNLKWCITEKLSQWAFFMSPTETQGSITPEQTQSRCQDYGYHCKPEPSMLAPISFKHHKGNGAGAYAFLDYIAKGKKMLFTVVLVHCNASSPFENMLEKEVQTP